MKEKWKWTIALLTIHGKCHDNWNFGRWQWLFLWSHTLKAIICLWLGLHKKHDHSIDTVDLAMRDFKRYTNWEFGEDATWYELAVGFGWRNWFYETYHNSWL